MFYQDEAFILYSYNQLGIVVFEGYSKISYQTINNKFGEFVNVAVVGVVVLGRDVDDRSSVHVPVLQNSRFLSLKVLLDDRIVLGEFSDTILHPPLVCFQDLLV
jgi:hypothetical protein